MSTHTAGYTSIIWQHSDHPDPQAVPLDENGRLDKATLLNRLKTSFHFPDYFGENWDAAYDLLLDHVDQMDAPAVWRFSIDSASEVNESDLAEWIRLMTDLCAYGQTQGASLQVVIQSAFRPADPLQE